MSDARPGQIGETRQRKLDDLFSEEPFLSPTMKARRLHDSGQPAAVSHKTTLAGLVPEVSPEEATALWRRRMGNESDSQAGDAELETYPIEKTRPPEPRRLKLLDSAAAGPAVPHPGPAAPVSRRNATDNAITGSIPIAVAAAYLRAECPSSTAPVGMERLHRFKSEVLLRWMKQVPARGIEGPAEEF